jgi:hypothetical protein
MRAFRHAVATPSKELNARDATLVQLGVARRIAPNTLENSQFLNNTTRAQSV